MRIAVFAAPLSRDGPGLLLRDILDGEDPEIAAIVALIDDVAPDVLLLTDFDYDLRGLALSAFSARLAQTLPYHFALRPNAGVQSGLDLDGDGFVGDARDALGYGRFFGDGGLALLSRHPIRADLARDLTGTLWRDVPGAVLPTRNGAAYPSQLVHDTLPVSSTGHWVVPIDLGATRLTFLAFAATPPIFDGAEDFNGLRNRDELRLIEGVLNGTHGPIPDLPILIGDANADPVDGDGLRIGIATLLARADLQDPHPRSLGGLAAADPTHRGDPALDTADWATDGAGNLRVSYILPSAKLTVLDAGVVWPAPDDPRAPLLDNTGPHRLVWVDIALP